MVTVDCDQGIRLREQNYRDAEQSGALVQESFRVGRKLPSGL